MQLPMAHTEPSCVLFHLTFSLPLEMSQPGVILVFRGGSQGPERLSNLPQVTQLKTNRAWILTHVLLMSASHTLNTWSESPLALQVLRGKLQLV